MPRLYSQRRTMTARDGIVHIVDDGYKGPWYTLCAKFFRGEGAENPTKEVVTCMACLASSGGTEFR